ncbi:hypothetical protein ACF0H5_015112 [Mactra antiquata]
MSYRLSLIESHKEIAEKDLVLVKQNAEILFCDAILLKNLHEYKKVKWIQSKGAGVDSILKQFKTSEKPSFILTRVNVNGSLVGEYVISYIIALEHGMFKLHDFQHCMFWASESSLTINTRMLSDLSICILGLGILGKEIAKRCKIFGMKIHGVTRTKCEQDNRSECVDQYSTIDELSTVITTCDYICCCLPSTPETRGLLSGDVLKVCSDKKPILINCGRGDLINEATVVKAIQEKWLGGAVLDVIEREPLPSDSLLWDLPNVYVTPHVSGYSRDDSNVQDYVNIFVDNYKRYCDDKPLTNVVNLELGY